MPSYRRASAERNVAQHHTESLDYHLINNKALQWHHHSSRHVQRRVLGYVVPSHCLCSACHDQRHVAKVQTCACFHEYCQRVRCGCCLIQQLL